MRAAALLMAVLMLTAGCLGFGGDEEAEDAEDDPSGDTEPSQNSSTEDGQAAEDGPGEHEHEPQRERHWDNKTGEVDSTNLIVDQGEPAEETTQVPAEALELSVTLSTNGTLQGEVYPPGCEEESEEPGEDCSHSLDGDGASWSTEDPGDGTWTIRLWKDEPGADPIPYTLEIWFAEEHEPAPGHHS